MNSNISKVEERWYLPTADGCVLFVREQGNGSPIVVLHGGPGHSHDLLLGAFDALQSQFRFVFYDQRGTLYSPCDISSVSFSANIQDLELIRKELHIDQLTLVAHSAGSLLALGYMEEFPDRVKNAVLIGSPAFRFPRDEEVDLGDPIMHSPEVDKVIEEKIRRQMKIEGLPEATDPRSIGSLPPKKRSMAATIIFAANFLHNVGRWRELRGAGIFHNPETEAKTGSTIPSPWDFSDSLRNSNGRVTVINGNRDHRININLWQHVHSEVPQLKYIELSDAGHASWIDQPGEFENVLREALN